MALTCLWITAGRNGVDKNLEFTLVLRRINSRHEIGDNLSLCWITNSASLKGVTDLFLTMHSHIWAWQQPQLFVWIYSQTQADMHVKRNAAWQWITLCKCSVVIVWFNTPLPVHTLHLTSAVLILIRLDLHNDFSLTGSPVTLHWWHQLVPLSHNTNKTGYVSLAQSCHYFICGRCDCLKVPRVNH